MLFKSSLLKKKRLQVTRERSLLLDMLGKMPVGRFHRALC